MALGSVVFYVLVLGRSLVGPYWDLVVPLGVAGALMLVGLPVLRSVDLYPTRGVLVGVLVTRHYDDVVFGVFSAVALVLLVASAIDLGRSPRTVWLGLALGVVASAPAFALAGWAE